jgi:hypothetical protein
VNKQQRKRLVEYLASQDIDLFEVAGLVRFGVAGWLRVVKNGGETLEDSANNCAAQIPLQKDPDDRKGIALAAILTAYWTGLQDQRDGELLCAHCNERRRAIVRSHTGTAEGSGSGPEPRENITDISAQQGPE